MVQVTEKEFDKVLRIIRGAENYLGTSRHQLENETHWVKRNGAQVKAAERMDPEGCYPESWYVEEKIFMDHVYPKRKSKAYNV